MEFEKYLRDCPESSTILEVGCGHGCSMYPIIENFPVRYVATDYSAEVLYILKKGSKYNAERCTVEHWDVTQPVTERLSDAISTPLSAIVCVFALSAVHPDLHIQCLMNMRNVLLGKSACSADGHRAPGVILFRDYGIHDMTMHRHKLRYSDTLFGRADGTLSYYFDVEYVHRIAQEAGLYVLELEYATVRTENRKARTVMRRVFVHAVLSTERLANQLGTAAQNGDPATPV
jgi:SAM-dependent methyltransferase